MFVVRLRPARSMNIDSLASAWVAITIALVPELRTTNPETAEPCLFVSV